MGFLDKIKAAATDPENQRKAKEAAQKFQDKRAAKKHHAHGRGHHTGHRGFGGHDEHEEEDEVVYVEEEPQEEEFVEEGFDEGEEEEG